MKRLAILVLAGLALATLSLATLALPARAQGLIGVVLLHGKQGDPYGPIAGLANQLAGAGYKVERPELCWSARRIYDKTFPDCLAEIDQAVARLRGQGATRIVIAGHSQGGLAAIAYGATRPGLAGIIGLSPAGSPFIFRRAPEVAASLEKAKALVAAGKGDIKDQFADQNTGRGGSFAIEVTTTPDIFLSFFGTATAADMAVNVTRLTAPLLWVAGDRDPTQAGEPAMVFDKAPANPLNRFATVPAVHLQVPDASIPVVLTWLGDLAKSK